MKQVVLDTWSQFREFIDKRLHEQLKAGDEVIVNSPMWDKGPPITKFTVVEPPPTYHTHEPMEYTWTPLEDKQ